MKKPRLKVIPKSKGDKKKAKLMEKILQHQYEEHKDFIDRLTIARATLEAIYGIKTDDIIWEKILMSYLVKVNHNYRK
jgi:hypothetical protein